MAVDVSSFFYVSAALRLCCSDVSSVVLRASCYARRPLLVMAVHVQLLYMHFPISQAVDVSSVFYFSALRLYGSDGLQHRASDLLL
jgi:hypothetical protein